MRARRSDSAASTCGRPTPRPIRERDALFRRGAVPDPAVREAARADPRRRPRARRPTPSATPPRASAAGGPTAGSLIEPDGAAGGGRPPSRPTSAPRSRPRSPTSAGSPRPSARPRTPDDDRRRASSSSDAGSPSIAPASTPRAGRRPTRARSSWASSRRGSRASERSSSPAPPMRDGDVHPVLLGAAGLLERRRAARRGRRPGDRRPRVRPAGRGPRARRPRRRARVSAWVTAAKVELVGEVGIDLPAGPSEGLVLADAHADPATVAADLITQAEHGPDSPALLVTPSEALADAVEAEVRRRLATALRRDILARALADHGRIVLVAGPRCRHRLRQRLRPRAPVGRRRGRSRRPSSGSGTPGSMFVGRWSPGVRRRLRLGREPRPAHRRPRARLRPARGRDVRQFNQVQRITREGLATLRPAIRTLAEAEGLLAHRDAVEARFATASADDRRPGGRPMSPSPFAVTSPTDPASYSWEATDEGVAERFGIPVSQVLRFDLNTSPAPPALLAGLLAAGRFETCCPSTRPATTGTSSRPPPSALRRRARRGRPGRGRGRDPRHVHEGVPARRAQAAVISIPTYAMYRIHAEQRGGRVIAVPRRPKAEGWAMDVDGGPGGGPRRRRRDARLGLQPEQPDRPPRSPRARSSACSRASQADAAADGRRVARGRRGRGVQRSSPGVRDRRCGTRFPNVVAVPHRLQGLRDGRPAGRVRGRATGRRSPRRALPAARARSGRSRPRSSRPRMRGRPRRCARTSPASSAERPRLAAALEAAGWDPQPSRDQLPAARPRARPNASEAAVARADAPRPRAADVRARPSRSRTACG